MAHHTYEVEGFKVMLSTHEVCDMTDWGISASVDGELYTEKHLSVLGGRRVPVSEDTARSVISEIFEVTR